MQWHYPLSKRLLTGLTRPAFASSGHARKPDSAKLTQNREPCMSALATT